MKIIYNNIIPFRGFKAINLFGVLFVRKDTSPLTEKDIRHETIHTKQMKELWYIGFYVWYLWDWLKKLRKYRNSHNAYIEIIFEREAYINESIPEYLDRREKYSFLKYK